MTTPITLTYRNWRGEIGPRRIIPLNIWFGSTPWHSEPCWLLAAVDMEKQERRDFALADCMFADLTGPGLRWNKTVDGLPKKPGKSSYEQVECLISLPNGDLEISMWNCEHEVWDDAEGDDYRHDPCKPTHWLDLEPIRAALTAPGKPALPEKSSV